MIEDLSDSRREGKSWLPADDRDVTNGLVVAGSIEFGRKPDCVLHGPMHRVMLEEDEDGARTYRCSICGVGARWWSANSPYAKRAFSKIWDARYAAGRLDTASGDSS